MPTDPATRPADDAAHGEPYTLLEINCSNAPVGGEGGNWVSYRIRQGANVITGYQQGTLAAVKAKVEQIVAALNERRSPRRGRVHLRQTKVVASDGSR